MKKTYKVSVTDGKNTSSFKVMGENKKSVRELCDIVHIGTGWWIQDISLALKKSR